MAISAVDDRRCQAPGCGRPLSDPTSRAFRIGPCCRRKMTPAQLRAALVAAQQAADPFHIPQERAPSAVGRRNRAVLHATLAQASAPDTARCHHDGIPGSCPMCRQEADPHRACERIIRQVKQERREHGYDTTAPVRVAAFLAFCERPVGRTPPRRRPKPAPAPVRPATQQLALEAV